LNLSGHYVAITNVIYYLMFVTNIHVHYVALTLLPKIPIPLLLLPTCLTYTFLLISVLSINFKMNLFVLQKVTRYESYGAIITAADV